MELPDLRFLSAFVAVYEARNLTRAAARLRRTQPTVTYQLRQLEQALGGRLFVREPGGMSPTPLGDGLAAITGRLAGELGALRTGAADRDRPLTVAAVSGFGRHVLAPLLRRPPFDRQRVTLRFPVAEEVIDLAARGTADVGFVFRPVTHAALVTEPVFEATYVLVAPRAWVRRLDSPAALDGVPLVTYDESDHVIGRWLGHHFGRRTPRWQAADHFEELEEVLAAVGAGRGVAVVPSICLPRGRGGHAVREVRWSKPPPANTVFAVRSLRLPLRPSVAALLEHIRLNRGGTPAAPR